MEKYDVVVIGAGPGGYPAGIRASQLGARVAIVEKEELGGTCLNWGCIPTKTWIAAAGLSAELADAQALGITVKDVRVDFAAMARHKNDVVDTLRNGVNQLLKANGIVLYNGAGSFKDRNRISVKGKAGSAPVVLGAERTIIATGSKSAVPAFLPRHKSVIDSRAFLELKKLPRSLMVMGGGYIGCELACLAAQLGVEVTIVELLEDILVQLDGDVRREVRSHMEKKLKIRILTGNAIEDVKCGDKGVAAKVGKESIKADLLLVSVGRQPVTVGLELKNAGLSAGDRGFVGVDDHCRTAAAPVYAVGDVIGGMMLAHAATSEGIIAAENACGGKLRRSESIVPAVIFTAPEAATVGVSEADAKRDGLKVSIGKFPYRALGRALAVARTEGFVKLIADAETDQVLGAAVVGVHATDLIAEAAIAVRNEMTVEELGRTIHAHPTFGELWMEAAHAVHGTAVHAAPSRRRK